MAVPLDSRDLNTIESVTIQHYDMNAPSFWEGTKDHDVSQNYNAFLDACRSDKPLDILDLGCGPGRDLRHFKSLGHRPVGLDGSEVFCQMARRYTGCTVLNQSFLKMDLPVEGFDGIFANASLFHVPSQELSRVLKELNRSLQREGVLFSSNPRGAGEGWSGDRYGHYMEFENYCAFLEEAGFEILHHYYRPQGEPCHKQPWLAVVSKCLENSLKNGVE
jgi:SAM-dependent methyltransferase